MNAKGEAQRRAEEEAKRADAARLAAIKEAERQRQLAYTADMDLAEQGWHRGNLGQLYDLLRRHVPSRQQRDLRGFEWFHLWRLWKDNSNANIIPTIESACWCWQGVSSDGSRMVIGHPYGENAVSVLDMETRQVLATFGMGTTRWEGVGVAISPNGSAVAYRSGWRESVDASSGGTVLIRDLKTGAERHIATDTDSAVLAFSHDAQMLAIGLADGTITVLDVNSLQSVGTMAGHQEQVYSLAFSPDDLRLASAGKDGTVRLWDLTEGVSLWVGGGNSGSMFNVAYSSSGKLIAAGGTDKLVVVWDASTGKRLQTLVGASDEVRVVAFSPDDELLAAGCREGVIRLWHLPDCTPHRSIGGFMGLYGLDFLTDGNLVFCGDDGHMVVHPVSKIRQKTLPTGVPVGPVRHVAFSSDSRMLCALNDVQADKLFLWQLVEEGAVPLDDLRLNVKAAAFVVSSQDCLAVGDADTATIQLYQLSTRQPLARLEKPEYRGTTCLAFSPSGQRLAVGCDDGHVIVWDVGTCGILMDLQVQDSSLREIAFCADETTLMTGGLKCIPVLWDVNRKQQIHVFPKHAASIQALAATRDGRTMASGAFPPDVTIRLYDRETLKICGRLYGHTDAVRSIRFMNGGRTLVSAAGDRTIRLWDVPTRQQRFVIDLDTSIFECLEVSPNDRVLAAGGRDGTVRLYRSASLEEVRAVPGWWRGSEDE